MIHPGSLSGYEFALITSSVRILWVCQQMKGTTLPASSMALAVWLWHRLVVLMVLEDGLICKLFWTWHCREVSSQQWCCITSCGSITMQGLEAFPWYPNSQSPLLHGMHGGGAAWSWIMCSSWHPGLPCPLLHGFMGTGLSCTGRRHAKAMLASFHVATMDSDKQ